MRKIEELRSATVSEAGGLSSPNTWKRSSLIVMCLLLGACRLVVEPQAGGSVISESGKIDCRGGAAPCVAWYGSSDPVPEVLEAVADPGFTFTGWSGACSGAQPSCELLVGASSADQQVGAHFLQTPGAVLVLAAGPGGLVRSDDGLLNCGLDCAASYRSGVAVELRAESLAGYVFDAWQGDCAGSNIPQCSLTLGNSRSEAGATFRYTGAVTDDHSGVYEVVVDGTGLQFDSFVVRDGRISGSFFLQVDFDVTGTVSDSGEFVFRGISTACTVEFGGLIRDGKLSGDYDASDCDRADGTISGMRVETLANTDFVNFESGQVRPLAFSADGSRLYAVNTPDNSLEVFALEAGKMALLHSIPVGMEPVSVASADDDEVWVVNHLSDSVSIVDLSLPVPQVVRTLQVGDEPRDIVFAGPGRKRAFITAARRGQNSGYPADEFRVPGLPRASVWVFDRSDPGFLLSGTSTTVVELFGDVPRALAVSPDGSRVFAAVFNSGNRTTTVGSTQSLDASKPAPHSDVEGEEQPATGLIVKYDGEAWRDDSGTDHSARVRLSLPDYDVFTINANATVPREISRVSGVGTTLFNMAVNPATGSLYVTNTEARNEVRFEGPGSISTTVRGDIARNRITVVNSQDVAPVELNPHVDFSLPQGEAIASADKALSLAQPVGIAVSGDGSQVYVAALGSNKVVAIPAGQLEQGNYRPDGNSQVQIPGGGPTGLVLDRTGSRLYVLSRYSNSVVALRSSDFSVTDTIAMTNPEPEKVRAGRRFLYDANISSSNGTAACASCHIFGDTDQLAWDLGNPDEEVVANPLEFTQTGRPDPNAVFHPMKGPMTTQTFRGISDSGPMHWRGDRTGVDREVVSGRLESVEAAAFKEFRGAFVGLLGREEELDEADLQLFTDFSLTLVPPPNPLRALDNSRTAAQSLGEEIYFNEITTGGNLTCNDCHELDPLQNRFGTGGRVSDEGVGISEDFKVPHFRNLYTKVGMFGLSENDLLGEQAYMGDQVRGFGFLHDGSMDVLDHFFSAPQFNLADAPQRRAAVIDFVMAADSNLAPVVGQQATLNASAGYPEAVARLDLLVQRALADVDRPECDLVAQGVVDGQRRAALLRRDGYFHLDGADQPPLAVAELKRLAKQPGRAFTFTCVAPGTGQRIALDSDRDGILNYDDED